MRIGRQIIGVRTLKTFNSYPSSEIVFFKRKETVDMFGFSNAKRTKALLCFHRHLRYIRFLNIKKDGMFDFSDSIGSIINVKLLLIYSVP